MNRINGKRVDTFSGVTIADKSHDEIWSTYEAWSTFSGVTIAENSLHWDDMGTLKVTNLFMPSREPLKDGNVVVYGSINVAQEFKKLESKLESLLERKFEHLVNQRASSPLPSPPSSSEERTKTTKYLICGAHTYETINCIPAASYPEIIQEYVNQVGVHKQGNVNLKNDPYFFTYNLGWRNHPNLSKSGKHWENNTQGGNHSYGQGRSQSFQDRSQG